ncbi:ankyrin repeat domain-containing protein [Paraburkholderia lycopersici]|uniref:ankyrin repeat domain-containing protein n=1 Tax=Paraburkholderia lycopersici TaxID=416944 RepID=UPI000B857AF4|nr:ankyrin repeat domain-containing protein [Paraburkholderia lycopersici]
MSKKIRQLASLIEKYRGHPEFLGVEITDPNQRGAVDDTLLHLAARTGAIADIQLLVSAGADINIIGDLGNTPLHQAAMMGQVEAVKLLLKLKARTDLRNEFDQTPMDVAELSGREEVIRLFKR